MEQESLALYLFHQGTNYRAEEYMGVHREGEQYVFRVWAPRAKAVFAVGDFNGWGESCPLRRVSEKGVFEGSVPDGCFGEGSLYKFKIYHENGVSFKADPYARGTQKPPETASVYRELAAYPWRDDGWLRYRARRMRGGGYDQPLNIYELHPGSWKRHADGTPLSYPELARELAPYAKQMGYTHVELMPVMEHPFEGSWGYQVTGYFSPTARFGTPLEFMEFVDIMHGSGVGVILDWVPAHFPKDAHGLYEFDGAPLYEYQGADRMEHRGWGTRCFDVGREEVQSFLISNAAFWARVYHVDGLRVDAVASMLYLDYDRLPGEWVPNVHGDRRNLEAIAFFQKLNAHMRGAHPDVMMIAEESTAWGNITAVGSGGLGFSLKWNMGWMNDTLRYAKTDPIFRKHHHTWLNFSMTYAFGERYVLPISHDEVVHGKQSLLDRFPGEYAQKFASARLFLTFMMTHPGKKLLFMGCEIGQFREWDHAGEIEWFLLGYEKHAALQHYVSVLNHFYLQNPPLYEQENSWEGFAWIDADNAEQSVLSYRRIDRRGRELVILLNFTPVRREHFRVGLPYPGAWQEVLNSDRVEFGGEGVGNAGVLHTQPIPFHALAQSAEVTLPALGAVVLRCIKRKRVGNGSKNRNNHTRAKGERKQ